MSTSNEAFVNPQLLVWARRSAGFTLDAAAKKAQVDSDRLAGWEQGQQRPTISQLRKLSEAYNRSITVFFLPEPPEDFPEIHDFRRLPDDKKLIESPTLRFEIRRAHERREVAVELYEEIGEPIPTFDFEISLSDNAESVGQHIRALLGLSIAEQLRWRDPNKALKWWRTAIENLGVLVFQAVQINITEMRGFSINERPLPVIVVNSKDALRGRIFTMLHEITHIFLKQAGICTLDENHVRASEEQRIESFCNRVAGATLVPKEYLQMENLVSRKGYGSEWSNAELATLITRYQVSPETMLRRLLICGYTTQGFYEEKREEFKEDYKALAKEKKGIVVLPHQKAINNVGRTFIRLVLNGYNQEKIAATDVSNLLDIRLKHLGKIEQAVLS